MPGPTTWIIGSAPACDVVVSQPSVSGQHCRLQFEGQQWLLEDLGSTNGTYVDGTALVPRRQVAVSQRSQVTLGRTTPMPWPNGSGAYGNGSAAGRVVRIGRGPDNDAVIDYPIISWEHARLVQEGEQFYVEDLNSRNGVAVNRVENRVRRAVVQPGDDIFLGSYKIPVDRLLGARPSKVGEAAQQKVNFSGSELMVGRDPTCDQPLDYPMISWHHAKLTRAPEGMLVEDLGSRNGTFVNGVRITGRVLVKSGDQIGLGSFRFQLQESGALVRREYYGNVTIEAAGVAVAVPGKRLIEPVSFTIYPSELVALMGPAGAGKTTLLKALNGYTPPVEGKVLFNGASLYDHYDQFRLQMGYVPQDDIVHPQLTVREALYYSVKLRTDLSESEIETRIDKVLNDLNLYERKNTVIGSPEKKVLSGGQRKRVNIALKLIHDTPVLFLDEPASGLSSYDAEGVMNLLKRLSREGKTIVTTIHQPSLDIFKQFDDLIMMGRDAGGCGAMTFFGPAYPDSVLFFNKRPASEAAKSQPIDLSPEMLLSGLETQPTETWKSVYQTSPYLKQFVEDRSGTQPEAKTDAPAPRARRRLDLRQWMALTRRTAICKLRDRAQTAILLVQAPLFALLIVAVNPVKQPPFADGTMFMDQAKKLVIIHFLMVIAAIWFGCNNAARDVVGEWNMFQRERMVSLKLPSYVFSKLTVLFCICGFQCLVMLAVVYFGCGLKGDFAVQFFVLLLAAMIGAAIGLCISSRANTTESAIALLPVVLLPVIALGGGLHATYTLSTPMQWVTYAIPSRWAFEANLANESQWSVEGASSSEGWGSNPDPRLPYAADVAELSVPRFVKDKKAYPRKEEGVGEFRRPLLAYLGVLSALFVAMVLTALSFLRMRDIH